MASTTLPTFAIRVNDLPASLVFYVMQIGFTLEHQDEHSAFIRDSDGDLLLLADPTISDLTPLLAERHRILEANGTVNFAGGDIDAQQADLVENGLDNAKLIEARWGDRTLRITDPDGYTLQFIQTVPMPANEAMSLFIHTIDELEQVVANLSDDVLDLRNNGWTIRQIVHHIVDSETPTLQAMKAALSEPGQNYHWNWQSNDNEDREFRSSTRPIGPSLALFRAMREHIAQIAQTIPDANQRSVIDRDGRTWTFEQLLRLNIRHALEHIDEIMAIKQTHQA